MTGGPLSRKLIVVTALKLAALAAIYAFVFAPISHAPIDPAAHIAGASPHP